MVIKKPRSIQAMLAALPFRGQRYAWVAFKASSSSSDEEQDSSVILDAPVQDANIVTSLMDIPGHRDLTLHRPVIDIDKPVQVVESTTGGHAHLYIDHMMPWEDYLELLAVMVKVGLVEEGYLNASKARGYTAVRLPWISKHEVMDEELAG